MKHKKQLSTAENGHGRKNILYVWNAITQNLKNEILKSKGTLVEYKITHNQNQGKAPPGRAPVTSLERDHPPENRGDPPSNKNKVFTNEFKHSNKDQNFNFYNLLIFTIMKKQILFLALFSLALIFAGMNNSYSQTYNNYLEGTPATIVPTTLTCASGADALHPLPGANYTYSITTNPAAVSAVHWFVTDQANVIATAALIASTSRDVVNGKYILSATTGVYDTPANTANTIDIAWKSFDGATNQVVLVAYVTGAAGCSDNIEVYRIEPTFGFTLDIAALLDNGTLGSAECVSKVESATYNGTNLTMNYGENWLFFTVNAANFVDSWLPSFSTSQVGINGTISAVEWAYPSEAVKTTGGVWNAATVPVSAQAASKAVGTAGEQIVLRVRVDHGNDEISASDPAAILTVGVNGVMFDPAASAANAYLNPKLRDLDNPAATGACIQDKTDEANYTLTPRPALTSTTVGVAPNPNPGPFEPKN